MTTVDPQHIIDIRDYSDATLRSIVEHLEASDEFSHLVYREAELDTILRLVTAAIATRTHQGDTAEARRLERLLGWAIDAHNFVGDRNPKAAIASLDQALSAGPWDGGD